MPPVALTSPFSLRRWLERPVDAAGLGAFRILFGLLIVVGAARFLASGSLDKLYCEDSFYFRYYGWSWLPVPSPDTVELLYVGFIVLGALIALGLFFRVACALFTVAFTWVQLIDVTNYLNHYYLVILIAFLLTLSPADAAFSLRRAPPRTIPFFWIALLRFQVACVYVFAALAKLGPDWLLYGQPLGLWLPAKDELPLIGPLLTVPFIPLALSWCGFLYDAAIVPLLSWRRTRPLAYLLVVMFHGLTSMFFEIGMFPFIMAVATTIFFEPAWPRRLLNHRTVLETPGRHLLPRPWLALAAMWCAFQVLFPFRQFVISENVLWDEAGMRFSWRVMVREKSGSLTYRVTLPGGRTVMVSPHDMLSYRQVNEMIGQPDMILQLAHHIRDDFAARGISVEVRADALAALNGRRTQRFVDPDVDLARVEDSPLRASFILPAPTMAPRPSWQR